VGTLPFRLDNTRRQLYNDHWGANESNPTPENLLCSIERPREDLTENQRVLLAQERCRRRFLKIDTVPVSSYVASESANARTITFDNASLFFA
jgi:hypothetical protein